MYVYLISSIINRDHDESWNPGINRDHDFHQDASDSQLDTGDQFVNESQILLQSLQGNSVLPQQDQLSSPESNTARSLH